MRRVVLNKEEVFSNKHLQRKSAFNAKALTAATAIVEDVRERIRENFPLAAPKFEEALAETGVQENDRVTVTPARIKKLESRSFKTESGIEIRIPAELCSSDDAVEFIHSATGGLSLLIKDVLV